MSEVKRYAIISDDWDYVESPSGGFVDHDDYAALEAECDALRAQLPSKGGEAVEVVGWLGGNGLHTERHNATGAPFPLMTVAQHQRIMAASMPPCCKVVPVELLERIAYMMEVCELDGPSLRELRALLEVKP